MNDYGPALLLIGAAAFIGWLIYGILGAFLAVIILVMLLR